jgi:putative DNA primase/helicase
MKIISGKELYFKNLEERPKIVGGFLRQGGQALLYAPPGVGKSMLSLKLAHDLSMGTPFLGFQTKKSRVLYIDAEMNENQIQSRMRAFFLGGTEMGECLDLIVCPKDKKESFAISDPEVQKNYWAKILVDPVTKKRNYDVVIFDNLYTLTYQNGFKDSEFDIWERVENLLKALEKYGICGIWIHHANKAGLQQGTVNKEKIMNCIIRIEKGHLFESNEDMSQVILSFDKIRDDTWKSPIYIRFKREHKDTPDELIKFNHCSLKQARVEHVRNLLRINPNLSVLSIRDSLMIPLGEAANIKEMAEMPDYNDPDADPNIMIRKIMEDRFEEKNIWGERD